MIKKISSILLILVIAVILVTGCQTKKREVVNGIPQEGSKVKSVDDLSQKTGILHCTRKGTVDGGSGTFNYYVTYQGDEITFINSVESVESDDPAVLKQYEDSYKKIDSYYVDIDHYDAKIDSFNNTVTHTVNIDYKQINIKKLVELEGEEDNIFENNKAKLSKYFTLAKKLGITCSESTT